MDGRRRNTGAYEKIAKKMMDEGFERTKDQIQVSYASCTRGWRLHVILNPRNPVKVAVNKL